MKKNIALIVLAAAALLATPAITRAQDATTNAPAAPAHKHGSMIHGKVSAVDATAMTVTVTGKAGDKTYTVTSDTKIMKDGAPATFADITVGEMVVGTSKKDGDKMDAVKITIGKPKKTAQ